MKEITKKIGKQIEEISNWLKQEIANGNLEEGTYIEIGTDVVNLCVENEVVMDG